MEKIVKISKLKNTLPKNKKIVLVGGCFDLLHVGHIDFLEKSKLIGDVLVLLLESDKNIKKTKGKSRPINSQKNRAKILSCLYMVNYIVLLPEMKNDQDYLNLIKTIKPSVIAITKNDPKLKVKTIQSKIVKADLKIVNKIIFQQSTTSILNKSNNHSQ